MKKESLYILLAVMLAVLCAGCEDRLNIQKHGSLGSPDEYYQTDVEVEAGIASMYASWRDLHYNWFFVLNCMSDDAWTGGGQRNDNADMEKLNEFNFDTDHSMIQGLYSSLYTLIYKANLIIDQVTGDTPVKKRAIAEAHVTRGWAHFYMVTLWGTAPIVDHVLSNTEYHVTNGTPATTWQFVETEFQTALDMQVLPSKSNVDDKETGIRLTAEAAKAFLGKAYLFQGKYAESADILDEVIDSQKYDLYRGEYEMLGHASTNNCCEAIFELNRVKNAEQAWNEFSQLGIMLGWRASMLSYMPGTEAGNLIAQGSYGFMNPQKSLYDAFVAEEGMDGYRLNSTMRTYEQMNEAGVVNFGGSSVPGNEGYFYWKTRLLKEDCIIDQSYLQMLQWNNLRIMRYAEVLLMAAEAHLLGGVDATKALNYVNAIRTRAKLTTLPVVTMDDVKKEKRLELCMESCRYQDLVRWGDAETVLGNQGAVIPAFAWTVTYNPDGTTSVASHQESTLATNTVYGFKGRNNLLPIPLRETEVNPNMKQNEGW